MRSIIIILKSLLNQSTVNTNRTAVTLVFQMLV